MADEQTPAPQFAIQKVYVKDMSFETPNSPSIFTLKWEPEINLHLNSKSEMVQKGIYEVVISVTITAKIGDKTAYLAEANQAGIFTITGFEDEQFKAMLGAYCPTILYPYAREAISDLVGKGGFPQLVLAPINFDALYQQKITEVNAAIAKPPGNTAH